MLESGAPERGCQTPSAQQRRCPACRRRVPRRRLHTALARDHERRRPPPHPDPAAGRAAAHSGCAPGAQAEGQEAPAAAPADPARGARGGFDDLRHDDGGRQRSAGPREREGVPDGQELTAVRRERQAAGRADERPRSRPGVLRPDLGVHAQRDHRDRGQAVLREQRRRPARHRPRVLPGHRAGRHRPGRLDDRPAVRQERAPGAEQAHRLREAQGVSARLPPHAQVVQAEDPDRVPELDLLRQRRVRDRVRRARVLRARPQPPGLRHAVAPVREGARPRPRPR